MATSCRWLYYYHAGPILRRYDEAIRVIMLRETKMLDGAHAMAGDRCGKMDICAQDGEAVERCQRAMKESCWRRGVALPRHAHASPATPTSAYHAISISPVNAPTVIVFITLPRLPLFAGRRRHATLMPSLLPMLCRCRHTQPPRFTTRT